MRRRKRNSTAAISNKPASDTSINRIDVWLQRSSYISQALMTAVTLAGLYFVVLPVYQKEVLTESIARKELELSSLQTRMDDLYDAHKYQNLRIFLSGLPVICSTMLREYSPGRSAREDLEFNVVGCWKEELDRFLARNILKTEDAQKLVKDFERALPIIEAGRKRAIEEYDSFKQVPSDYKMPENHLSSELDKLLLRMNIPQEQLDHLKERSKFDGARSEIVNAYRSFVSEEALKLLEKRREPATPCIKQ